MKKLLLVFLGLLLLCGCGETSETETEPTTLPIETTVATEPVYHGTYEKDSEIELQTQGAVRRFRPGSDSYTDIAAMGDDLLLICTGETTRLELVTEPDCSPKAQCNLNIDLSQTQWVTTDTGLVYYDAPQNRIVTLDTTLSETASTALPENMTGTPVIGNGEVYFCRGSELWGMALTDGTQRLIRAHSLQEQTLAGCWFDGTMVLCRLTREDGSVADIYVSTGDGSVLAENTGIVSLVATGDRYYVHRVDDITDQYLCGIKGEEVLQFHIPGKTLPALHSGLLIGLTQQESGITLTAYDATTGHETGAVTLADQTEPIAVLGQAGKQSLWLLMENGIVLSWDVGATAVEEGTLVTTPVFTAENPDTVALEALEARVQQSADQYGVEIKLWQDAVQTPGGHILVPEYQASAIDNCLTALESVFAQFPEGFLKSCVDSGLRVCIVRSADGQRDALHYWNGTDAYVVVCCAGDPAGEFLKALGYFVDVHVLGNSSGVDKWAELNPPEFGYGFPGEPDGAFTDPDAMVSVVDDRAHVFWKAMLPGNEELFATDIMQQKLLTLCKAIRDAWGLKRSSDTYPWEQYLHQSIAYQK